VDDGGTVGAGGVLLITSTTEPPSEPESDIPSDEDLVAAATVGGKNFFDLTASDLDAGYSSRCTATLGDLASDLVLAQGLIQSFMGIDEAYLGVDSIEHVGDGSEALVAVSWRDADGNVLGLGDPEPPASWAVEGGRWKYYGDDCLVDPTCDSIVAGTPEDAVGASQCSWDAEPNTIYFVSERTCDDGTAHVQVDRSGGGAWIGIPGGGWTELDSDAFTVENIEALCTE